VSPAWDERLAAIDASRAAALAAERFGLTGPPQAVSTGANLIFLSADARGPVYLRLNHALQRAPHELAANVAWLQHLERCGAPVSPAVLGCDGRAVENFQLDGEAIVATAVREVPGRAVEAVPDQYAAWGRALAQLHRASEGFAVPAGGSLRDWTRSWAEARERLPSEESAAWRALERVESRLAELPTGALFQGVTHADCNRTNALFDGERVWIIDFDEPTVHWFAADVARPFRELTAEDPARDACLEALVAGYREERAFEPILEAAIPLFIEMKNIEIFAWLWGSEAWAGDELPGGRDRDATLAAIRASFEDVS
jgi:Ser/Thr protein kinase RdoA (MazF antagonist)